MCTAERASELARDDAYVFHVNDVRRVKASFDLWWAWFGLHRDTLFLLQRLCYGRSTEASDHWEIWVLGFVGPHGLHHFIWGYSSSLMF